MGRQPIKPSFTELIIPLPRMTLNPPLLVEQMPEDAGGKPYFFGYAVNLTREGIFIPSMNPKPMGYRTRVRFLLPSQNIRIEGQVEVVWSRAFDRKSKKKASGMGIKFLDLSEETMQKIDAFLGP